MSDKDFEYWFLGHMFSSTTQEAFGTHMKHAFNAGRSSLDEKIKELEFQFDDAIKSAMDWKRRSQELEKQLFELSAQQCQFPDNLNATIEGEDIHCTSVYRVKELIEKNNELHKIASELDKEVTLLKAQAWFLESERVKELEKQIEKMRYCTNCIKSAKYRDRSDCPTDYTLDFCDKWEWELKESNEN